MTTLDHLKDLLKELDLKFEVLSFGENENVIRVAFLAPPEDVSFRDSKGQPAISLFIRIMEKGEFIAICSGDGWDVGEGSDLKVFEVLANLASRFKMIRFDYEGRKIRPNVEMALEDNSLTSRQLGRMLGCILQFVRQYDLVVTRAIRGEEDVSDLAEEAGGISELRRILKGKRPA